MNKVIEIDCAVIEKLEKGIIKIAYRSDYKVELGDVKEVEQAYIEFSNGEDIYSILVSDGGFKQFTSEAQNFLAKEASIVPRIKGSAVVLSYLPFRMMTRFFITFFKPQFPIKIFSDYSEALAWLLEIKNRNNKNKMAS